MSTEAIEPMKQFRLYVPPSSTKSYTENDDGTLTIEGIASTTNKDLQGDIILPSAIESMKTQLLTTTKNLHGDHLYGLDGIYGAIKEVLDSDENALKIKAILRRSKASEIKEMLEIGVNLGLSIGGKITEYTIKDDGWEIKDLRLMEISLTGMPANWDTYGTITESVDKNVVGAKCLSGACHVIRKNLKMDDNMPENRVNEDEETAEFLTKEDAEDLFNELMANKQEEIARETVDQVSKELRNIVQEEFKKLTENNADDGDGEDTDKDNTPAPEDEDEEEKEKALTELINATVKNAMNEGLGNLFKELGDNREPKFHADDVKETDLDLQDNEETEKGLTSKEIAEKMFSGDSKDSLIRSLLG